MNIFCVFVSITSGVILMLAELFSRQYIKILYVHVLSYEPEIQKSFVVAYHICFSFIVLYLNLVF